MMRRRILAIGLWLAASGAAPLLVLRAAGAEECSVGEDGSVSETRAAKPNGVVDIEMLDGAVKIIGWNRAEVSVKGHVERAHFDVSTSADRTRIRVNPAGRSSEADLEIRVPEGSFVEVKTVGASIDARGVKGTLRVESVSGDVAVSGAPVDVSVRSASGDLELSVASAVVSARSVSGEVRVRGARGRASVESVSGDCTLEGGDFSEVEMRTVSGEVKFVGGIAGQGSFEFKSHSGQIELRLPPATNADFELRSFSGEIESRLGSARRASSALDFRAGGGGAKVRVRTFSGDVLVDAKR
jgi:hypothetical protein